VFGDEDRWGEGCGRGSTRGLDYMILEDDLGRIEGEIGGRLERVW
jgi:hypothetical protein